MYYIISFLIGVLVGFILTKIFSKKVKQIENDVKKDIGIGGGSPPTKRKE